MRVAVALAGICMLGLATVSTRMTIGSIAFIILRTNAVCSSTKRLRNFSWL